MPRLILALGLIACAGCAGNKLFSGRQEISPVVESVAIEQIKPVKSRSGLTDEPTPTTDKVRPVAHVENPHGDDPSGESMVDILVVERRHLELHRFDAPSDEDLSVVQPNTLAVTGAAAEPERLDEEVAPIPLSAEDLSSADCNECITEVVGVNATRVIDLNLPSALAMIDGQHPAVGFAQWRVQEAYAQLARAKTLWLPSINAGFGFHRHDGNYQASDGSIIDVNRNSFQYGLGNGATGAGTTMRPGLVARFHFADAIFQPKIARATAWARCHAANAVVNQQLLTAANAYIELVGAHQDVVILAESRDRTAELSKITSDFAEAGEGLQADADRMRTELILVDNRLTGVRERIAVASARLSQALSLRVGYDIIPLDVNAVPIELMAVETDKASLITTGLTTRPELKESQTLVAAACEAYRREKCAPLVPSVLLGFSTGGFGGGLGNELDDVAGRYDFDALMSWQVRNFGFGERAARRESSARVQQAKFEKLRVMDQVAREVSEAYSQVQYRREQMRITEQAITSANDSYRRNLSRIRDGQGIPLEVLQSVYALESAQQAYLKAVIDHNQAQFRLQWALGWPVSTGGSSTPQM